MAVRKMEHDQHDHDDNEESDEEGKALKAWWRQRQFKRRERRAKNVAMFDVYFDMRQRCGALYVRVEDGSLVSNATGGSCSCGGPSRYRIGTPPPEYGLPACELRSLEKWLTPTDKRWLKVGYDVICDKARTRYAALMLYELLLGELLAARLTFDNIQRSQQLIDSLLFETLMASKRLPHGIVVLEPRVYEKVWLAICAYHHGNQA